MLNLVVNLVGTFGAIENLCSHRLLLLEGKALGLGLFPDLSGEFRAIAGLIFGDLDPFVIPAVDRPIADILLEDSAVNRAVAARDIVADAEFAVLGDAEVGFFNGDNSVG